MTWTINYDRCSRRVVRLSLCLPVTRLRHAKTAERIEVLFGVKIRRNPRRIVLDWNPHGDAAFAKLLWPLVSGSRS